mgnify:CR=1 FL=1
MPSTLVIADLHLSVERSDITECFFQFLTEHNSKHDALYILGDLFEAWVGDDDVTEFTDSIANAIHQFSNTTPVYFIHGNRDFLLGRKYAQRCGMTLLPEQLAIELYGRNVLFMHGDQLCTDDVDYQVFRKKSRTWWWRALMLMLPLSMRRKKAEEYRRRSIEQQSYKSLDIMDVNQAAVQQALQTSQSTLLIHGHTHRPAIHKLENNKKRIVVGDWYTQGSVLTLTESDHELSYLPFNEQKQ